MIKGGFDPKKIIHIPTFVESLDVEHQPLKKQSGILYVGRLSREKGVDLLIEAFGQLRNSDAVLTIAGETGSEYAQQLIHSIPDQLKSRVSFIGFQNQDRLASLYRENLLFVVPSAWYENQPNVLLEGMAHAGTSVVPRLGSFEEIVKDGETGQFFDPGSSCDLANKIDLLLENPLKAAQMGVCAQKYVCEHHALTTHIAALEDLFGRCR
jgi:glycosyltransferase involved in cell wall biosynthesis